MKLARTLARNYARDWATSAAALAALVLAILSLSDVLLAGEWIVQVVVVVYAFWVSSGIARALGARWLSPLVGLVVGGSAVVVFSLTIAHGSAASNSSLTSLVNEGITDLIEQEAPAIVTPGITFLVLVATLLAAALTDSLVYPARIPALTGLLPVGVLSIPPLLLDVTPPLSLLAGCAVCYVAVLLISRGPGWSPISRILSAALVLPLVLAIGTPLASTSSIQNSFTGQRIGSQTNLALVLSNNLTQPDESTAFTYTFDGQAAPPYFALSTITDLGGAVWTPDRNDEEATSLSPQRQLPSSINSNNEIHLADEGILSRASAEVAVTLANVRTNWLPAPHYTYDAPGLSSSWQWGAESMSAYSTRVAKSGDTYQLTYTDLAEIRRALSDPGTSPLIDTSGTVAGPNFQATTELPSETPDIVSETARRVAPGTTTLIQMNELVDYFLSGEFTYSTTAPAEEGYSGTGAHVTGQFLEQKRGYCVQFAGALALMARSLDIPARIVVGYTQGTSTSSNEYTVSSDDMHAWVEAWVPQIGWLPFDSTPGVGANTSPSSSMSTSPSPSSSSPSPTLSATPSDSLSSAASSSASNASTGQQGESNGVTLTSVVLGLALAAIVLAILVLPALARRHQRRTRLVRANSESLWHEIVATARDLGWGAPRWATSRECAEQIGGAFALSAEMTGYAAAAAAAYDAAVFSGDVGPTGGAGGLQSAPVEVDHARQLISALTTSRGVGRRVFAVVAPTSLLSRGRRDWH